MYRNCVDNADLLVDRVLQCRSATRVYGFEQFCLEEGIPDEVWPCTCVEDEIDEVYLFSHEPNRNSVLIVFLVE